jgi:predicted RecA/RadA family phage recombinase
MKNFIQEGTVFTIVATNAVKSGDLTHAGSVVGICACDATAGAEVECRVEGVFEIPKIATSEVLNAGSVAKATFGAGVGRVGAAGANSIGWVTETSGAGVATVRVRLIPGVAAVTAADTARSSEETRRKSE